MIFVLIDLRGLTYIYIYGFILVYLFGEFGKCERQVYRPGFAVVNGETPGTAAPLTTGVRQLRFSDGHVSIRTAVQRVRDEPPHGERVKRQLKS